MNGYFLYRHAWRFEGAPHNERQLSDNECKTLLREGGLLVRNTFSFDKHSESCFWYVVKNQFGGFDELSPRTRNKVRHANESLEYKFVDLDFIRKNGYPLIEETFADYRINDRPMNEQIFNAYLNECAQSSFDYWGIFDKTTSEFVGFCTVHVWDNCCEYGISAVRTQFKHNATYPFYGLYFVMNQYYLENQHFKYVTDSARTITNHSEIHDFLIHYFGFRKAYCNLKVYYKWWVWLVVQLLFPFRKIITLPRVKAILNMEAMQRGKA